MNKKQKQIGLIIAGALVFLVPALSRATTAGSVATLSYLDAPGLPSGMRKNNPGNIRSGAGYQGEIGSQSGFAVFQTYAYGIRAMILLLIKYIERGSSYPNACVNRPQNTIKDIITQWAPPYSCGGDNPDNAVTNYIAYVSNRTGIPANQKIIADRSTLRKILRAMAYYEQGREAVTDQQFNYAYTLI